MCFAPDGLVNIIYQLLTAEVAKLAKSWPLVDN